MDRQQFHMVTALSALCKTAWQQRKHIEAANDWSLNHELETLRNMIKRIREDGRRVAPINGLRMQERSNIAKSARSMYENSRKVVTAKPGKTVRVDTFRIHNEKFQYDFTVRWGWYRKVYLPFYDKANLDCHEYFVITVERVRVNHPHILLFEADAYDFKEKRQRTMWIGQSNIGDRRAAIKNTSSDAIRAAISLYDKQFKKDLTEKK